MPKAEVLQTSMQSELKKWGFGLIGFGALHFVLSSVLDPIWGGILIVIGICNLLIPHRALFLVNGMAIMVAAIFNGIAMGDDGGAFGMVVIMQFVWGVFELRKYKLYSETSGSGARSADVADEPQDQKMLPLTMDCRKCGQALELDDKERTDRVFTCPECNSLIDMSRRQGLGVSISRSKKIQSY